MQRDNQVDAAESLRQSTQASHLGARPEIHQASTSEALCTKILSLSETKRDYGSASCGAIAMVKIPGTHGPSSCLIIRGLKSADRPLLKHLHGLPKSVDPPSYEEGMYVTAVNKSYEVEVEVARRWDRHRWDNWRKTCRLYNLWPLGRPPTTSTTLICSVREKGLADRGRGRHPDRMDRQKKRRKRKIGKPAPPILGKQPRKPAGHQCSWEHCCQWSDEIVELEFKKRNAPK